MSPHRDPMEPLANQVFRVLFGFYGNAFLDKFRSGERSNGVGDTGIDAARAVWDAELRKFDPEEVAAALQLVKKRAKPFPPSLPEFLESCRACIKPKPQLPEPPREHKPMSPEMRSMVRSVLTKTRARSGNGLASLTCLVAQAVELGGGNEAETLLELDRHFHTGLEV